MSCTPISTVGRERKPPLAASQNSLPGIVCEQNRPSVHGITEKCPMFHVKHRRTNTEFRISLQSGAQARPLATQTSPPYTFPSPADTSGNPHYRINQHGIETLNQPRVPISPFTFHLSPFTFHLSPDREDDRSLRQSTPTKLAHTQLPLSHAFSAHLFVRLREREGPEHQSMFHVKHCSGAHVKHPRFNSGEIGKHLPRLDLRCVTPLHIHTALGRHTKPARTHEPTNPRTHEPTNPRTHEPTNPRTHEPTKC